MNKPEYWEPDEVHEQYEEWLRQHPEPEPEPLSPLQTAIARARGEVLTDEDMKKSIDFLNRKAAEIKKSYASG